MKKYLALIFRDDVLSPWPITFSAKDSDDAILVVEDELADWKGDYIYYEICQLPPRSFKRHKAEIQILTTHASKGSYHRIKK